MRQDGANYRKVGGNRFLRTTGEPDAPGPVGPDRHGCQPGLNSERGRPRRAAPLFFIPAAGQIAAKFFSIRSPTNWLFSGWNCVANTFSRHTAAANGSG